MPRVSIINRPLSIYLSVIKFIKLSMMQILMLYLFQENKSSGVKTHMHSSSDVRHCTSQLTSGTITAQYKYRLQNKQYQSQTYYEKVCYQVRAANSCDCPLLREICHLILSSYMLLPPFNSTAILLRTDPAWGRSCTPLHHLQCPEG